jgi:hypothetical protein
MRETTFSRHYLRRTARKTAKDLRELLGDGHTTRVLTDEQCRLLFDFGPDPVIHVRKSNRGPYRYRVVISHA